MELELGLAPPMNLDRMIEEFDLNNSTTNGGAESFFLQTGLPDPDPESDNYRSYNGHYRRPEKWRKLHHRSGSGNEYDSHGEIEGWPPIKHDNSRGDEHRERDDSVATSGKQCMYVKVKMEGVGIGRKIDLTLYDSYETLTVALINMFAKYGGITADNRILYKDSEGDWMLLGDVPWDMFIESVQRIEILSSLK